MFKQFLIYIAIAYIGISLISTNDLSAQSRCTNTRINLQGVSNADIVVSSVAIAVLAEDANRCEAIIVNTGTADMRCTEKNKPGPSATIGVLLTPTSSFKLSFDEARKPWDCIRTTGVDAAANVVETIR